MIVVHVNGGLGNQLFQLAAGKALATRLGVELRLDTRLYNREMPIELDLGLHRFAHGTREAKTQSVPPIKHEGWCRYLSGKIRGRGMRQYREASLAYDASFSSLGDQTYLKGYWQSEKYFVGYEPTIREMLTFVTSPSSENRKTLDEMHNCLPVSLHIRRAAFVSVPKFHAIHGTCDLDYYQRAAQTIAEKTDKEPVFYAFSDEPDWVQENLKLPFEVRHMRQNDGSTNYEDMRLMSACHHHILANSSFSWWGAWLNPSAKKIVIAPKRWFADPSMQVHDIISPGWLAI